MTTTDLLPAFLRARLAGRATIRQALDNSFWLFCDQVWRMGLGLVMGIWMARYLGPEQFGLLSYAIAIVAVVSSFTSLGINAVVVRELVRDSAATEAWMGTAFGLKGTGAGVGFLVCVALAWWQPQPDIRVRVLIPVVALSLLFQTFEVIDLLFQARREPRISAWVRIGACTLSNLFKLALILIQAPLLAFAASGVLEIFLSGIGWLWSAKYRGWKTKLWRYERARAAALMKESWPLAISGLAIYAQAYADQIMLGALRGSGELGQYAAAMRLVGAFGFIPMVAQTVAAPEITQARKDNLALYHRRLHGLYRFMLFVFLVIAVPMILLGPWAVTRFYGVAYAGAAGLLPWLTFRLFFTNFGVARSLFITNEGLFGFALVTAIAGAVVNIMLNMKLIPLWGARGAIISSLISFAITTFSLEWFQPQTRANLFLMAQTIFLPWRRSASE